MKEKKRSRRKLTQEKVDALNRKAYLPTVREGTVVAEFKTPQQFVLDETGRAKLVDVVVDMR